MEIKGKYGTAKIFTNLVDDETIKQVYGLLNSPISQNANVRIMPDCHAGAGCVIGTTMQITDKVCPNIVGVDIGCGVFTVYLGENDIDLQKLDQFIKQNIPHGFGVNEEEDEFVKRFVKALKCYDSLTNKDRIYKSLGTLGGGNHFIEIDIDDEGGKYLLVHSGSRNLGLQIAKFYQNEATKLLKQKDNEEVKIIIETLKSQNKHNEIAETLKNRVYKREWAKELDYLEGEMLNNYLNDMQLVQTFAYLNRETIARKISSYLKIGITLDFDTVHNYIDTATMILRKGAVSAEECKPLIIPINMRDGALICEGKGNVDWNYSAPHGAGRVLSRSQAKATLTEKEFVETMEGIYTTTANINTIDEAPMVYKPIESIIENIGDTVEIVKIIKPIYNFKAN